MPRFLITDPFPGKPLIPPGAAVIAPNAGVSRALGVPTRDLQTIAKEALRREGFGIAAPIKAANVLSQAVRDVLPNPDDVSAVARHVREIVGTILRSGIDTAAIIRNGSAAARQAAEIAARYSELLAAERFIDSDAVLSEALRRATLKPEKVLIYGYFRARQLSARPEEIEFIDRKAGDGSIFYLPVTDAPIFKSNREWAELLVNRRWERQDPSRSSGLSRIEKLAATFAAEGEPEPCDSFVAIKYPDLESEVRGTLARSKAAALSGVKPRSIAVVCRDMTLYAASMIATAREYHIPIDIDCDVPIGETPFGEFVSLIFETLEKRDETERVAGGEDGREGFRYETTLRLLLHRFGPGISEEQRSAAYARRPDNVKEWRLITSEIERLETPVEMTLSKWSGWLKHLLFDWDLRGVEKLASSAADITAFDNFFDSLDHLASERGPSPITTSEFAIDVADILANIKTPMHTERGGIKVLLPNAIVGSEFERVFVVGMSEGILPMPASDSHVIDFFERERLREYDVHFEDSLEVPRWEALSFYFTLLACRGKIVFSYPLFAEDTEQIESSYFKRMGIEPKRASENFVSGVEEYRRAYLVSEEIGAPDQVFPHARRQFAVEQRRESSAPQDEYDGVTRIPVNRSYWNATSLSKIGACPFRWFADKVLHLNEPAEADADLAPDLRGRLYHKTLEFAVNKAKESGDVRAGTIAALEEEFAKAEAEEDGVSLIANWDRRRSEHLEALRFAVAAKKFFTEGAEIVGTELSFEADRFGITISGKIDRVDRLPDGRLHPIDYKTGGYVAKIKDENGDLTIDIQLPIYSLVGMPELFPDEPATNGIYFNLTKGEPVNGKETDLAPLLAKFKSLLEKGQFPVDPDNKGNACTYCQFDLVCRTGTRLGNKEAAE